MSDVVDYKSTLNLPKTSFPMKGNLPQSEPKTLKQWEEGRLYSKLLERRKGAPTFVLHDGPPYANGDIHIGHALNKVLKDVIVRYKGMRGMKAPYIPGWDCHGLPIEYALMKELKVTKHQVDTVDFRRKARGYAQKYVGLQREQFKRLGVLGDWDHPYLTLEPGYVSAALRVLSALAEKKFIYRARKPVNWCWSCETALAEAEVEYENREDHSVYVRFPIHGDLSSQIGWPPLPWKEAPISVVIWTTTPWTLFDNEALCFHPDEKYSVVEAEWKYGVEYWVIAKKRLDPFLREIKCANVRELGVIPGNKFSSLRCLNPFYEFGRFDSISKGLTSRGVSMEEGTGIIHIAPAHGQEDHFIWKQHYPDEPFASEVDEGGKFLSTVTDLFPDWKGKTVTDLNETIVTQLCDRQRIVHSAKAVHSYPHCWRCRSPIIFRATDQWFLKIDHETNGITLREKLLQIIEKEVRWIPPEGKERIAGMVKTRPDWCLSRQRLWGIPIPAVICHYCDKSWLKSEVIEKFAEAVEKDPKQGSDLWFTEQDMNQWLPGDFRCDCGPISFQKPSFRRGTDILDVWFDSGVSHQGVLMQREDHSVPADLYLEGSDQHRGWFQVSLITSVALSGKAPYRGVLTHGFVVDGEGRKMSKSLGNVVAPQEVVSSLGADVLRLWVASSDYREDIRISPKILSQVSEVYRKIRNTIRFCLANPRADLSDLPVTEIRAVGADGTMELNRWMLIQLDDLISEVTDAYEKYAFHRAVKAIHEFCTVELSNFYLDVIKDQLYTAHPNDPKRREIQTVLAILADRLIRLMAPILPFTAEEAWGVFRFNEGQSVHLQDWPMPRGSPREEAALDAWSRLLELRDEVMKELEKAREAGQIGDSLEAKVTLTVRDQALWKILEPRREAFEAACIVSELLPEQAEGPGPAVEIQVRRAPGSKCQRCWKRLSSVGTSTEHPGLCQRCVETVKLWYTSGLP